MSEKITLNGDEFTPERIKESSIVLKESLIGDELQHDQLSASIDFTSLIPTVFCPTGPSCHPSAD